MPKSPSMNRYTCHIFICTGRYCDPAGQAARLYARLAHLLGDLGRYENPCRVKRGTSPCLGVCQNGPIVVVYPEGIWYHQVDDALLERIVAEHLRNDQPIIDWSFHRLLE